MWLIVLSVVAIGCVQSATVGYPYQTLWSYNSNVQGQNPVNTGSIHGYLRYLDNNAAVVGNTNSQPVYAVHQIKYVNSPASATSAINIYDDVSKIREACIRTVTFQQYQNLKRDIDVIKSEGKVPSVDKMQKLQTLEKIAFTSDFSLIADLPEVKLTIQELNENINRLYNESIQSVFVQQPKIRQIPGEINTHNDNLNVGLENVEETAEQRQAREEHLRIYNEQIAHLKHLELEHEKYVKEKEASLKSDIPQKQQLDNAKALAELEQARQEHFRLWNEAKLRAEQAKSEDSVKSISTEINESNLNTQAAKQQIDEQLVIPAARPQSATDTTSTLIYKPELPLSIMDTPEVAKAREEHLRLVHEANVKAQLAEQQDLKHKHESQASVFKSQYEYSQLNHPNVAQIVQETPEVVQAREEHLRLVEEAKQKAQLAEQQDSKYKHESQAQVVKSEHGLSQFDHSNIAQIVQETPEVEQARKEHYRVVQESQQIEGIAGQQDFKYKHEYQAPVLKSQYEHSQFIHPNVAQIVQETPEVMQAREEHLRLVQEAKQKAQQVTKSHNVQETPVVVQASEKHFHQANEAKLKENLAEKRIVFPSEEQQHYASGETVEETSEVVQAREEHLRLYNAIKSHVEQEQAKIQQIKSVPIVELQQKPLEEKAFLELERIREIERLQKEQQQLEMDRLSEIERLAEEKQQMEAELMRLKLEDEQRLKMEHLLEIRRLQEEQEKLKNGEYQVGILSSVQEPNIDNIQQSKGYQIVDVSGQEEAKIQQGILISENSLQEEKALLELENIREMERLEKEKQQLELDRLRDIERLAEEKKQMEAELIRLKLDDEQRLEMERLFENRRLQEEQEKLKTHTSQLNIVPVQVPTTIYQHSSISSSTPLPQVAILPSEQSQSQQIVKITGQYSNPFLKLAQASSGSYNRLELPIGNQFHQKSVLNTNTAVHPSDNTVPSVRRVPSSHQSSGNKHQHIHDDNQKPNKYYPNIASPQPADTAVALSALERATNEHFRAHERALEQLRLARLQNSAAADCN